MNDNASAHNVVEPIPVTLQGIGVSPGLTVGPALLYHPPAFDEADASQRPLNPTAELERLRAALDHGIGELRAMSDRVSRDVGRSEGEIFAAQALMLEDPTIAGRASALIEHESATAVAALRQAAEEQAMALAQLPDPIWQERATDIRDAVRAAHAYLTPQLHPALAQVLAMATEPVAIIANDLAPSDTAHMSPQTVCAIVLAQGAFTSHAAILARALHIPAVAGLGPRSMDTIQDDDLLVVDGARGTVTLHPDETYARVVRTQAEQYQKDLATILVRRATSNWQPGSTSDGHRVQLLANVGSVADAQRARAIGAEGIGLLRTEFLFSQNTSVPDEQHQADLYTEVIMASGPTPGPIVVRTLDAGGDKPLSALAPLLSHHLAEANPALGVRGIRLQAGITDLLATQLRAIVRAARRTQADV